jgi:hypothetical protein
MMPKAASGGFQDGCFEAWYNVNQTIENAYVLTMPNRCAKSLKKMRTCAIGFFRTSTLFM